MKTFVIAEAGVNHNGSEALALELVEVAARCGADAVKFQTFNADKLVSPGVEKALYQEKATGDGDQYSMLKNLELSLDLHHKINLRCNEVGIEFMSTPFDENAADFLMSLGMRRIKVPSGEITNFPFLRFLASKDIPLIVSTGMANLSEVQEAVSVINDERERLGFKQSLGEILCILHCTSNYPAADCDVNLRAMKTIAQETGLPVGYSDHTLGVAVSTAAVAMGAVVIEKHFTLDKNLLGPDHQASLDPQELRTLVAQIRSVEVALGNGIKQPVDSELPIRSLVRRSVSAARNIPAGKVLELSDLCLLRPGIGIEPKFLNDVVGLVASRPLDIGTTLIWSDLVANQ